MGKDIHDIELFRRLIAPRHTAFNVRISEKSSADRKTKKSKSKKKKPPPERWSHTEPLNVHLQNRIGVSRCRAPPD